jgi:hypothetical protein
MMEVSQTHSFAHEEARERMRALSDYFCNKYGMSCEWTNPDSAKLLGKYLALSIEVHVTLENGLVRVKGTDPGMLLRGTAKRYVAGKLEQYLNKDKKVKNLPRGLGKS